ncbi:MAG: GNAT family N-acetyltransferase, partial [Angustibacter sp.]
MIPPTLTDGSGPDLLVLRPHVTGDVTALVTMCTDPQVQQWTTVPVPYKRRHAEQFVASRPQGWEQDTSWSFAIEAQHSAEGRRFAGNLDLRPSGSGAADVGFALSGWARGRGVMSRALRAALRWGFEEADLTVVHWSAHVDNWASRRVAWACGFTTDGTVRGLCQQRGLRHDGWIGSVVRAEPLRPRGRWLEAPPLRGDRVLLRPWVATDAPRVVEACRDPLTQFWLTQLPTPYTPADAQWYVRSREDQHAAGAGVYWCVADPDDDDCLASVAVMHLDGPEPEPEIGYWAHPDARGRGVMTDAVRLAARHALICAADGGLGQHRVTLRVARGNTASRRVAEQAGFTRCGTLHGATAQRNGTREDYLLYE